MRVIKVKVRYSFLLIAAVIFLSAACKTIRFTETFNGFSTEGFHSRGLDVNDSLVIVTGAKGKVSLFNIHQLSTVDTFSVPASDLRGVQFVKNNQLLLMNSGNDGLVYQYHLQSKAYDTVLFQAGAFFDAISINSDGLGYVMGDPINNEFVLYKTEDFGSTWKKLNSLPKPLVLEAGFAASNTGLAQIDNIVMFATGASDSARIILSRNRGEDWSTITTPMKSGGSFGIYTMVFWNVKAGVIAGGSYVEKTANDSILFVTRNGGNKWVDRSKGLPGYISCVTSNENGSIIVATGRLGAYYSTNKGKRWQILTSQPFYSATIAGKRICLSGQNGSFAVFQEMQ